jgi:hypothetical protein
LTIPVGGWRVNGPMPQLYALAYPCDVLGNLLVWSLSDTNNNTETNQWLVYWGIRIEVRDDEEQPDHN